MSVGDIFMQSINAIFDGTNFKVLQPIPVKENYKVVITFVEPITSEVRKHIPLLERLKHWNNVPCEPEPIDWGKPVGEEVW